MSARGNTRIEVAPEVADDLERILNHLREHEAADAAARIRTIIHGIDVLGLNPEIGRPADSGMRELVLGRGSSGYVALYRYVPELDTVFVLAVRAQREAGYQRRDLK
jgi:toxin ParE1/3/4